MPHQAQLLWTHPLLCDLDKSLPFSVSLYMLHLLTTSVSPGSSLGVWMLRHPTPEIFRVSYLRWESKVGIIQVSQLHWHRLRREASDRAHSDTALE